MIEEISIQNLGIIDQTRLPLGPGFTALTGETGAGKTMVVTALGLLLGNRANTATVRQGSKQAQVSGIWQIPNTHPSIETLDKQGIHPETINDAEVELIVSRTVSLDGRSRVHIAGTPVPVATLSEVSTNLVTVHGQSDQLRLKNTHKQREALDKFAGEEHLRVLEKYRQKFDRLAKKRAEFAELTEAAEARQQEAEELRASMTAYEQLQPETGEVQSLLQQIEKLQHQEDLHQLIQQIHQILQSDNDYPDVITMIGEGRKLLEQATGFDDDLAARLTEMVDLEQRLHDLSAEISGYALNLSEDPSEALDALETRRAALLQWARPHNGDLDEAIRYAEQAGLRLLELDQTDETLEVLSTEIRDLENQMSALQSEVTGRREEVAKILSEAVTAELQQLAMPDAVFTVEVTPSTPARHGADTVKFLLASHPGAQALPVAQTASGGELSRVMLGLEVVLAEVDPVPTMVFDEVDAGVGGAAALEIGKRLAKLSKHSQIVAVTHLAQVAVFANNHLRVMKSSADDSTISTVRALSETEREEEIARLLSGQPENEIARKHAQQLIQEAKSRIE